MTQVLQFRYRCRSCTEVTHIEVEITRNGHTYSDEELRSILWRVKNGGLAFSTEGGATTRLTESTTHTCGNDGLDHAGVCDLIGVRVVEPRQTPPKSASVAGGL